MQSQFAIDFIYRYTENQLDYPGGADINLEPEHAETRGQ